jgi:hypothetical protein
MRIIRGSKPTGLAIGMLSEAVNKKAVALSGGDSVNIRVSKQNVGEVGAGVTASHG